AAGHRDPACAVVASAASGATAAAGGKHDNACYREGQPCDFLVAELRRPSLVAPFAPVIRPRVVRLSPFSRWLPVIRSATSRGTESQYRPTRLRPVSPAHPDRLMPSRPVSYRVHELAEA